MNLKLQRIIQKLENKFPRKIDLKDPSKLCYAMERQSLKVFPGTLLKFNSYLPHEFKVDNGIDAFRFIHLNIKIQLLYL